MYYVTDLIERESFKNVCSVFGILITDFANVERKYHKRPAFYFYSLAVSETSAMIEVTRREQYALNFGKIISSVYLRLLLSTTAQWFLTFFESFTEVGCQSADEGRI